MNRVGNEVVAERVHLHQWREPCGVPEVVSIDASRERRARSRLDRPDHGAHLPRHRFPNKWERKARKVRPSARAPNEQVRGLAQDFKLPQALLPDDGLVEQHMVQNTAQRVPRVAPRRRRLHGLGDRDPEAPRAEGVLVQNGLPRFRERGGGGVDSGTPSLHHRLAVGFLVIGRAHLPHLRGEEPTSQNKMQGNTIWSLARGGLTGVP